MTKLIFTLFFAILTLTNSSYMVSAVENKSGNQYMKRDTTDFLYNKFKAGIDFYATGNEPNWSLDLTINRNLVFNTMSGLKIELGNVKGIRAMDSDVIRYASPAEEGFFSVTISAGECTDNMSGDKFDYKVIVEINNSGDKNYKSYSGCGKYVPDYSLNKKWILKKLGDNAVSAGDYMKALPELQFDIEAGKFSGNAGCNRIMGRVKTANRYMKFMNPVSTLMMCPDMGRETKFLKALAEVTDYSTENNELKLSNPDNVLMVFYDSDSELNSNDIQGESSDIERSYRLNDIWVLESLDGIAADKSNFGRTIPLIEINMKDMKLNGTGGCNRLMGNLEVSGNKIKIDPLATTRMYCKDVNESGFIKGLQSAETWKIENNRLYLMQGEKVVVVMKKVD